MESLKHYFVLSVPLIVFLQAITACSNQTVTLIDPQSGSTTKCSATGTGLGTGWVESFIGQCIRQHEGLGYVPLDKLTAEERADLEKRGLLPKE
jgi:hypothetical protein